MINNYIIKKLNKTQYLKIIKGEHLSINFIARILTLNFIDM